MRSRKKSKWKNKVENFFGEIVCKREKTRDGGEKKEMEKRREMEKIKEMDKKEIKKRRNEKRLKIKR